MALQGTLTQTKETVKIGGEMEIWKCLQIDLFYLDGFYFISHTY